MTDTTSEAPWRPASDLSHLVKKVAPSPSPAVAEAPELPKKSHAERWRWKKIRRRGLSWRDAAETFKRTITLDLDYASAVPPTIRDTGITVATVFKLAAKRHTSAEIGDQLGLEAQDVLEAFLFGAKLLAGDEIKDTSA